MVKTIFLSIIKGYQLLISPVLGDNCRFYPSCSNYAKIAIRKHGAGKGTFKAFKRILRCNQWNPGGVDNP